MSSYGRNFEFRVPPTGGDRSGRYHLAEGSDVPIGAPVVVDTSDSESATYGSAPVDLATGDQAIPKAGLGGVLVYEHGPAAFAGSDAALTTYSDMDTAPDGKLVQVVSGKDVKVVLRNTDAETFLNTRSYTGRTMVAGVGIATPTVVVGDGLTPGDGNDTDGYWAETATAANQWLIVTKVDNDRKEIEARLNF